MGLRAQEILIGAWNWKLVGEKKKAKQNRPILVITDSGELALKDTKGLFFKKQVWC